MREIDKHIKVLKAEIKYDERNRAFVEAEIENVSQVDYADVMVHCQIYRMPHVVGSPSSLDGQTDYPWIGGFRARSKRRVVLETIDFLYDYSSPELPAEFAIPTDDDSRREPDYGVWVSAIGRSAVSGEI